MYSKVLCETLRGINGVLTYVEADSSNGLPSFLMVGNLASSVKEAGDRVRTALKNSNVDIPAKKVTINIAPADIRKDGTSFDLPIAVAILKSLEMIPKSVLSIIDDYAFQYCGKLCKGKFELIITNSIIKYCKIILKHEILD